MGFAGSDRRSFRTEEKRRRRDIEFLDRVRSADDRELWAMLHDCRNVPWKVVAIERMIMKAGRR